MIIATSEMVLRRCSAAGPMGCDNLVDRPSADR